MCPGLVKEIWLPWNYGSRCFRRQKGPFVSYQIWNAIACQANEIQGENAVPQHQSLLNNSAGNLRLAFNCLFCLRYLWEVVDWRHCKWGKHQPSPVASVHRHKRCMQLNIAGLEEKKNYIIHSARDLWSNNKLACEKQVRKKCQVGQGELMRKNAVPVTGTLDCQRLGAETRGDTRYGAGHSADH